MMMMTIKGRHSVLFFSKFAFFDTSVVRHFASFLPLKTADVPIDDDVFIFVYVFTDRFIICCRPCVDVMIVSLRHVFSHVVVVFCLVSTNTHTSII
jgi:hypothetical protein